MSNIEQTVSLSDAMTDILRPANIATKRPQLICWCRKYGLGYQLPTGRWRVYPDKLQAFIRDSGQDAA